MDDDAAAAAGGAVTEHLIAVNARRRQPPPPPPPPTITLPAPGLRNAAVNWVLLSKQKTVSISPWKVSPRRSHVDRCWSPGY